MAISLVGTQESQQTGGLAILLSLPTMQEGDLVVVFETRADNLLSGVSTLGYATHASDTTSCSLGIYYKFMGPTPDTAVTVAAGANNVGHAAIAFAFRGVDTRVPFDVAATPATGSSTNPNPAANTPVTFGAWAVVAAASETTDTTVVAPSGYTNQVDINSNTTDDCTVGVATLALTTKAAEDPGTWTTWSNSAWRTYTVLLRPQVADWLSALSEPVRRASSIAAMAAGLVMVPVQPAPVVPSFGWFAPLSTPAAREYSPASTRLTMAVAPPASIGWFAPLSIPSAVDRATALAASSGVRGPVMLVAEEEEEPEAFIAAYTNTVVPYYKTILYQSVQEPVPRAPFVAASVSSTWYQPLSEPVRRTVDLSGHPSVAYTTPPIATDVKVSHWQRPFVDPVRREELSSAVRASGPITPTPVIVAEEEEADFISVQLATVVPYSRTILYQSIQEPVPRAPFVAGTISATWYRPLAEPTRPEINVSFYPALSWAAQPLVGIAWYRPLSEPTRREINVSFYPALSWATVPIVADVNVHWYRPFATPVRRSGLTEASRHSGGLTGPTPVGEAPEITASGWWTTVLHTRAVIYPTLQQPIPIVAAPETVTVDKWHQPLAVPTRREVNVSFYPPVSWAAQPIAGDVKVAHWHRALSEPVRREELALAVRHTSGPIWTTPPIAASVTTFTVAQLTTVVPYRKTILYQSVQQPPAVFAAPEVVTVDKWHGRLSEPIRRESFGVPHLIAPPSEIATLDKWHAPWREPVRRELLGVHHHQAVAFAPASPFTETVSLDRWQSRLSEPTRVRRAQGPTSAYVDLVAAPSETVTVDKWFIPWSRTWREVNPAAFLSPLAFAQAAPFNETVSVDRWLLRLNEPVRVQSRLLAQPAAFAPTFVSVAVDQWRQPFSEPKRSRDLPTAHQDATKPIFAGAFADAAVLARWFAPLTEPTRRKGLAAHLETTPLAFVQAAPFNEAVTADRWLLPLALPVRRHITAQLAAVTFVPPTQAGEIITVDKWFGALNLPTRAEPIAQLGPVTTIAPTQPAPVEPGQDGGTTPPTYFGTIRIGMLTVQAPFGESDPFFLDVLLLAGFNGLDGAVSYTAETGQVASFASNARLDTEEVAFGTAALRSANSTDFVTFPNSTNWDLAASDTDEYTIEWTQYLSNLATTVPVLQTGFNVDGFLIRADTTTLEMHWNDTSGTSRLVSKALAGFIAGVPQEICVEKNASNVMRFYIDGVMVHKATIPAGQGGMEPTLSDLRVGASGPALLAYTDEVRITGVARYDDDAGYTPTGTEFPRS